MKAIPTIEKGSEKLSSQMHPPTVQTRRIKSSDDISSGAGGISVTDIPINGLSLSVEVRKLQPVSFDPTAIISNLPQTGLRRHSYMQPRPHSSRFVSIFSSSSSDTSLASGRSRKRKGVTHSRGKKRKEGKRNPPFLSAAAAAQGLRTTDIRY